MRKKEKVEPTIGTSGVAEGIDFSGEDDYSIDLPTLEKKAVPPNDTEPSQGPKKYYIPKPKSGSRGGRLGRPPKAEVRERFTVYCTSEEKQIYAAAAEKEGRKLQDFIQHALKKYIEENNL